MKEIFKIKGFTPYLIILFLNAFTDLGHKILLQNTVFKGFDGSEQIVYISIINSLILIPFVLVFSPAGFLSDRYAKHKVIQKAALFAIGITALITFSYYIGNFYLAFGLTLLLSLQSAFYSPAKYGYLKELVGKENLATGNALVQSITIVSIILSSLVYSMFFEHFYIENLTDLNAIIALCFPIGFLLILNSVIEYFLSLKLPEKNKGDHSIAFNKEKYLKFEYLKNNIKTLQKNNVIWLSIIGISIFWGVSQALIAIFPSYAKDYLEITNTVTVQMILAMTAVGIIFGSLYYSKISKHYIEAGTIPLATIIMAIVFFAIPNTENIILLYAEFFIIGFASGTFIVPLNSLIQYNAEDKELGKIIAGNNFVNSIFMLLFLAGTTVIALFNVNSIPMFYLLGIIILIGSFYALSKTIQAFVRYVVYALVKTKYEVTVNGMKNIPSQGGVLLLGNHTSWLDWALIQIACPRNIRFVMFKGIYEKWYLNWFLKYFKIIPIASGASKNAIIDIRKMLADGEVVCLFPEGQISRNGQILEFKKGFEKILNDESVKSIPVIPFYIHGLWGSSFSAATPKFKEISKSHQKYRKIIVSFGEEETSTITASEIKQKVIGLSSGIWEQYVNLFENTQLEFLKTAKKNMNKMAIIDSLGMKFTYGKTLTSVIILNRKLKPLIKEKNVGILLPSSAFGAIANLSLMSLNKTLININYTSESSAVTASLDLAEVKEVVTSKKFLNKLKAKGFNVDIILDGRTVVYLEDLGITTKDKVLGLIESRMPSIYIRNCIFEHSKENNDTALILFSSGSEGTPKGVELTHKNIISNVKQIETVLNPSEDDVIMGVLPLFHAFGITVTTFFPLLEGIPVVMHPDPTDAPGVAKLIYTHKGTILCGTSTFLSFYNRNKKVDRLMLDSLKIVISGAEKLNPSVREAFGQKFGKEIYEGYGATETAPVASVNVPNYLTNDFTVQVGEKKGSVGLPITGTLIKIVDPETNKELPNGEAGMILISGPQIMKGYLKNPEKTKEVLLELDNRTWYITGDKGKLDEDGFVYILDRYSRFIKLSGEMLSLTAVENNCEQIINTHLDSSLKNDNSNIEAIAVGKKSERKGEVVALVLSGFKETPGSETKEEITKLIKDILSKNLEDKKMMPVEIIFVDEIPKLGSGKKDFKAAQKLI